MSLFHRKPVGHGDLAPIYYVYVLFIFHNGQNIYLYGGKGSGNRMYQHMKSLRTKLKSGRGRLDAKERLLLLAQDLGYTIYEQILKGGLTEDEAFNFENEVIRKYGLLQRGNVAFPHRIVKTPHH